MKNAIATMTKFSLASNNMLTALSNLPPEVASDWDTVGVDLWSNPTYVQLFYCGKVEGKRESAKALARAFGGKWFVDSNNYWEGSRMVGDIPLRLVIHGVEDPVKRPVEVDL